MKKMLLLLIPMGIAVAFWVFHMNSSEVAPHSIEADLIRDFYRGYMNGGMNEHKSALDRLPFSKSFIESARADAAFCDRPEHHEAVCGWAADGDVFLDSQEHDGLTFENSHFTILESLRGHVRVAFNVETTHKVIDFILIEEDGKWVVDDFVTDGQSTRAFMQK